MHRRVGRGAVRHVEPRGAMLWYAHNVASSRLSLLSIPYEGVSKRGYTVEFARHVGTLHEALLSQEKFNI